MLSINTNLSSLIAQNSLKDSTNILNQAIERLTTGYKINHASDNAANYSITNNITSLVSSLQVAEDNAAQGLDMINTASDVLEEINDRVQRLRDLQEQASNGTYGEQSLKAINVEVNALIDEINRLYQTTEYNNIVLFERNEQLEDGTMAIIREVNANEESTFKDLEISDLTMEIYDIDDNLLATVDVEEGDTIGDLFATLNAEGFETKINDGQITISSFDGDYVAGELADALGISKQVKTYVVSTEQNFDNEIIKTLSSTETITETITISTSETITETIPVITTTSQTLTETIWTTTTTSETLTETIWSTMTTSTTNTETVTETIQVETTTVKTTETVSTIYTAQTETLKVAQATGFIQEVTRRDTTTMTALSSIPSSTYLASGTYKISTTEEFQLFADMATYDNFSSTCEFILADNIDLSSVSNWSPIGDVTYGKFYATLDGNGYVISNLTQGSLFNTIASGAEVKNLGLVGVNVEGSNNVGALAEDLSGTISNCYISGTVSGSYSIGGLVGCASSLAAITNCYVLGTVSGASSIGGLVGRAESGSITNCYVLATVSATGEYVGGLVGDAEEGTDIANCYASTTVSGIELVGGLVGGAISSDIKDCYASGTVNGTSFVGGLVGYADSSVITNSYALSEVIASTNVGGLIGYALYSTISNSYSKGTITGTVNSKSITNSNDWDGTEFTYDYSSKEPATLDTTLGELGVTVNQNFILPSSTVQMTSTMTMQEFINEIKKDSAVTNAELVDGVLLISTANASLNLSTGFLNSNNATQTSTKSTATITITETIMVDKEIESEVVETIWTTTTSSETFTETVWTTTTTSETLTETIWTTTTTSETLTETLWTTTTSETTRTETTYVTNTITLTNSTKLEDLGVTSMLNVTILSNGTRTTVSLTKDKTLDDLYTLFAQKGINTSRNGNEIVFTGEGDTYISSKNLEDLLELSAVSKTNGNRSENTISDKFMHSTYIRGVYAPGDVRFQVGINSNDNSQIECEVSFKLDDLSELRNIGLININYAEKIDKLLLKISERQTKFGAVQNRLESALDEISTQYENLVSSRSTICDADIAEVSAQYIQQQILQQAAATLLATANQSPSIALQLI